MSDVDREAIEVEAPVNPYSLLEAVNSSSDTAHKSWLIFLGLMSYLLVAVAGVSHTDLLLNNQIPLPIVQVKIELRQFFLFAPIVMVLLHLGVITQLVMLARKAIEFDKAMRLLEVSDRRTHPLRLELHNFFFVQAIAGARRSMVMGMFLHMMTWLTLAVLPVLLLLFIQTIFLPYHDELVTWVHRIALVCDAALLVLIGVFLVRAESSFFQAFFRSAGENPLSFVTTSVLLGAVLFFSFFVATIPGEFMAQISEKYMPAGITDGGAKAKGQVVVGYTIPFMGSTSEDGSLFGVFHRNINVKDLDLVADKDVTENERTLNLRGRDLRYARLDRSDLHQADFTGSNLSGASLDGTILRRAIMKCANPAALDVFTLDEFDRAVARTKAKCVNAKGAIFTKAQLSNAKMQGINLTDANFKEAQMDNVDVTNAIMPRANFSSANLKFVDFTAGFSLSGVNFEQASLQGANFKGVVLHGANFNGAKLQGAKFRWASLDGVGLNGAILHGADLREVWLQGADLGQAQLQGAMLGSARLAGAKLNGSNLDGSDLRGVWLHGADLTNASIRGADLRGARIWKTKPPELTDSFLADVTTINMQPISTEERAELEGQIGGIEKSSLRDLLRDDLKPVLSSGTDGQWMGQAEQVTWSDMVRGGTVAADALVTYRTQITAYLGDLMCNRSRRDGSLATGSVATGIVKQAVADDFRGDKPELYGRLQGSSCPTSTNVPSDLLATFSTMATGGQGR